MATPEATPERTPTLTEQLACVVADQILGYAHTIERDGVQTRSIHIEAEISHRGRVVDARIWTEHKLPTRTLLGLTKP